MANCRRIGSLGSAFTSGSIAEFSSDCSAGVGCCFGMGDCPNAEKFCLFKVE